MTFGAAVSLAVFAALILAASLQVLAASGHFPLRVRGPGMHSADAVLLFLFSLAVTLVALIAGALAAWEHSSWQGLVIAGGLAVLSAPLVLQQCSDHFVDGRVAPVAFAAATALCALLLVGKGVYF